MTKKIIIVGAFHEIIELAEENDFEIAGIIDNEKINSYRNYNIICNDEEAINLSRELKLFPILITPDQPFNRQKLMLYYRELGFEFITVISKDAKISKSAIIGLGTIIQFGVNVSAECVIGQFVKLNTKCNVMHNSIVGDFTTIAPNAVILGNVKIGKLCYIGANATILPNIEIGNNSVIGAGCVVTKNINKNTVVIGNPSRYLRDNK